MTSRRVFVKNGAFAVVSLGFAPAFLARAAFAGGAEARSKRLIAIFQRGAVDGLSAIVPFGDQDYYRARPTIAIGHPRPGADGALDLDGFFGLHPRLGALKRFWDAQQLAVIHACGSPDNTRSHFDAQDYLESATPGVKRTSDGWLNRYLQAHHPDEATPFRAVAVTPQLPRALHGSAPALAINQVERFGIRAGQTSGQVAASFETQFAAAADQVLNSTGREAFEAIRLLKRTNPSAYRPDPGADYPRTPFGQALKQIAQLSKANVGLEVAFADTGGWDTHVNQGSVQGQLAARLSDFGNAIAALATDLGDRLEDTVILTMSEFGRAVSENGSRGTDHGHGNAMIAIGGGIRGGRVYGTWPGLAVGQRYEGRDLAVTTDFRDVFAELVVRHLGVADPKSVFPGYTIGSDRFPGLLA
jgi:uncharacterized protein (DUF1501 family)